MGKSTTPNRSTSCLACGNEKDNRLFSATEKFHGLGGEFVYLECHSCRSVQLVDIPTNMANYYPSNYYAFGGLVESSGFKNIIKNLRFRLFQAGIKWTKQPDYLDWMVQLGAGKNDLIADIGCGNGQLLYELKCSGFKSLVGFDPYLPQEISESGFCLERKDLMEISGSYDILMLHHSFEHLQNPKEAMKRISKLLKPKGKLLVRVPVTDAAVWEKEGTNWFQLDAPRHFFIPSKSAMKLLGEKSGLRLTKIIFDSNEYQFVITDMYKNGKSLNGSDPEKWADDKSRVKWKKEAELLNQLEEGDQACFYFQKE
jgi:SAM-dependent methyltransferase